MPRRVALVVLLAVFALTPQKSSAADWMRLRSANFTFEGDVGEQDMRAVAQRLEQFRAVFAMMFPTAKLVTPTPVTVLVFRHAGDLKTVAPRFESKPVEVAGFAGGGTVGESIAICLEHRDEAFSVAYHEYAHLLIRNAVWDLPLWLNEGLAQYYQTFEMSEDGTRAVLGRPLPVPYIELLRARLFPVPEILATNEQSRLYNVNVGIDRHLYYAESWLLVHYMLHGGADRRRQFEDFVSRLTAGLPASAAFAEAVPHQEKLGTELSSYIHQPGLKAAGISFADRVVGAGDFTLVRMTPAEAEAAIGLELVRQERFDEAKKHLSAAAARAPETASVQTGLGLILGLQGKPLEALPALRKGVELADDNAMAHFALGYVALKCKTAECIAAQGGSAAAARALERAVQLVPRFPEALVYLGAAEEANGERDAADRHLLEAVAMLPGREDFRLKAGEIYIRQQNEVKAQAILGPMAAASPNAANKARARELLGELAVMRARREAAQSAPPVEPPAAAAPPGPPPPAPPAPPEAGATPEAADKLPPEAKATPVFRTIGASERRLESVLETILCPTAGAVVVVHSETGVHRYWAPALKAIDFITYRDDLKGSVGCGPAPAGTRVFVTFRNRAKGEGPAAAWIEGRVVAIEYLPKGK
jgi:tetratricopeptide (TPR) repeat protein